MSGFYNTFKDDTKTLKLERFPFFIPKILFCKGCEISAVLFDPAAECVLCEALMQQRY